MNDRYCQITGYTREELLGRHWIEFTHPDDRQNNVEFFGRMTRDESALLLEKRYIRKNGEVIWVSIGPSKIRDASGQIVGGSALVTDITERKHAANEAIRARSELEATLAAIPDLVFEVDLDGRYLNVHASRPELLAAPIGELIDKTVHEILPPDAADVIMSALREADETGHSYGRQIKLQVPNGTSWFELSIARKAAMAGQQPSFIVLSHDITERKRKDELIRKSSEEIEDL